MENQSESKSPVSRKRIMHPLALVVFVPLDVEISDEQPGIMWADGKRHPFPVLADPDLCSDAASAIGRAVVADERIATALDMLMIAAREISEAVPGTEAESTAWFGISEFQEV